MRACDGSRHARERSRDRAREPNSNTGGAVATDMRYGVLIASKVNIVEGIYGDL